MSHKKLVILGIVAAGMVVWAIVQSNISNRPVSRGVEAGANLLQGFDPAAIGSIVLQADGNVVTLSRQGDFFIVVEREKYQAKTSQINNLITSCLDIQTAELITSDKAYFAELGVSDDKPGIAVKFFKPDKSIIAGILIGKTKETHGTYVRLVSSDKTYLSTKALWLPATAMDYIDRVLTEVKYEDIVKVSGDAPDGSYVIVKDSDKGSVLTNIPAGKRAKTNEVQQVFSALSNPNLTFDDVIKDSGKMKFDKTYVCQLKDSTVYTVSLASKGNKTYAKWTADFMDKSAVLKKMGIESEAELKAKEAKLLARDKAEEFTKKTQGWIYEIPESQAKILTMKFTNLIEDEPKNSGDANKTMSTDPSKRVPYDPNKTMPYNPNKTNK
jgi:hypothetical protein